MSDQSLFGNLFLSAGAMKAGTTWLYQVLGRHPELHFTPEKEIHYFYHRYVDASLLGEKRRLTEARNRYLRFDPDRANIDRVRLNLHWVGAYLSEPVDDLWYRGLFAAMRRETYACDFSNLYALLPAEAWRRIAADCNRLRVLYTLRHPVRRLWSHVKFHLQISQKADCLDSWGPEEFDRFARQGFIWDNAEYGRALRAMKAGLPEGALKVIFYEDLHADQRAMLAELETFLGIARFNYPAPVLDRTVNASVRHPMPDFFPGLFAQDFARITAEIEAEGLTIPDAWRAPLPAEASRAG